MTTLYVFGQWAKPVGGAPNEIRVFGGLWDPAPAPEIDDLTADLLFCLEMDEGSSSNDLADAHSGGIDFAQTNSPGVTTGKIGGARTFTAASSQYATHVSTSALQFGDFDRSGTCWVRLSTKGNYQGIFEKGTTGAREAGLYYDYIADRISFFVNGGAAEVAADSLGSPSTATWYFVYWEHDSANNRIRIRINNGAYDSVSHSGGITPGAGAWDIGRLSNNGSPVYWNGSLDQFAVWDRLLSDDEQTVLYNSSSGLALSDWPSGSSTFTGSGALTTEAATSSGTGAVGVTGTGSLASEEATTSGTGWITLFGSGALATEETAVAGTGNTVGWLGTGTLAIEETTTAGTGWITVVGTGALTTEEATLSGSGTATASGFSGSGTLTTEEATSQGAGWTSNVGSGALATEEAASAGTGNTVGWLGTGSLATDPVTASGSGTATAPTFSGTGALEISEATAAGTGWITVVGMAALAVDEVVLAGVGSISTPFTARRAPTLQGSLTERAALLGALTTRTALAGDLDMATPGTIQCFRGEDFTQPFAIAAGGLTGRSLALRVYTKDGTEVLEYTTGGGEITITSDTACEADFASADTDIAPGRYQFSLTFAESGSVNPLSYGLFEVLSPPCI